MRAKLAEKVRQQASPNKGPKKLLLTGVAGFAGAHCLEHLLENTDWDIYGVDSLKHSGNIARVEQVLAKKPDWNERFNFLLIDLAKEPNKMMELPLVDYIINMASESHVDRSISTPVPFVKNNVDLTLNVLEYARLASPDVFIQISTDEVYGPMTEEPYVEWERFLPSNPYSASKAAQEMIAISYWRTYGVPLVITNCMNMIGEMQDVEKFVPLLIKKMLANEEVSIHGSPEDMGSRYYLHARNHADALLFILENVPPVDYDQDHHYPEKFHIIGDTRVGNLEMAEKVARLIGQPLHYKFDASVRPGHDLHYGLDGSKLHALGWRMPLSFEQSLKRTVDNYMEHPQWLK